MLFPKEASKIKKKINFFFVIPIFFQNVSRRTRFSKSSNKNSQHLGKISKNVFFPNFFLSFHTFFLSVSRYNRPNGGPNFCTFFPKFHNKNLQHLGKFPYSKKIIFPFFFCHFILFFWAFREVLVLMEAQIFELFFRDFLTKIFNT